MRYESMVMSSQHGCFHCGLPVPAVSSFSVAIDGAERAMCCAGCAAVAQAIVANGLTDYYRHRDAMPESPADSNALVPEALRELGLFDHPDVQKTFVRPVGEHEREAALILEGITCSACIWLNESHLRKVPGVVAVDVNYATRRARVRWNEEQTRLSVILQAISDIGYRAHPYDVTRSEEIATRERKTALWRLFVAGFGMMQVMMYAVPVYLADVGGDMSLDIAHLMRWASLILTAPVVLYSAAPFFRNAWRDLRWRRVGMDVPVAIGVGAAFAASAWATVTGSGNVYFDSVTMFVFFLLSGRYFELMARQRATRGVEAIALAIPALATRYVNWPDTETAQCAVADLMVGDVVLIKPGEVVPADGVLLVGETRADESLLTGESRPVAKTVNDALVGGSVNMASPVSMRVQRVGEETRLATIQRLMERSAAEKPRIVELADRVAAHFVLALLLLAAVTGAVWWWFAPDQALGVFVAVLVVSCPCALSLATPTAMTVGTGAMAARGLLVTRGHSIETLARVDTMVFDKTGTLTEGRFSLVETVVLAGDAPQALAIASALEHGSEHPIATILQASAARAAPVAAVPKVLATGIQAVAGAGVEAEIEGVPWRIGTLDFVGALHQQPLLDSVRAKLSRGETAVALGNAEGWVAFFLLDDKLRDDAALTVAGLRDAGLAVELLSGDAAPAVRRIAERATITTTHAAQSPEAKHAHIRQLQQAGHVVAMIGDGVNDAPVLAQAQVSVAMAGGADLARAHADVVLLGDRLAVLSEGIALARQTMRIVRQNLYWAAGYNAIALPLAMAGWVTPWMAGIGMSGSSLLVVLNALRLQRRK